MLVGLPRCSNAATKIRSTDGVAGDGRSELAEAATSLWQACRAMPTAAATAALMLVEGLLLVPLWAALRCALAAWHWLHQPAGPASTPHAPGLPGAAPPVR